MPSFNKDRNDARGERRGRLPFGVSRRQILPTVLLVAAGVAVSFIIGGIPVGVQRAFSVSADVSSEEEYYTEFSPADMDVLKDNADAPVREFSEIAGQLAGMKSAVERTSYEKVTVPEPETVPETQPAVPAIAPVPETVPVTVPVTTLIPETTQPTVIEELIDRSNEVVSSGNKNLYKSNYYYGAPALPLSGGSGLNTSGVAMSELALPASLKFDENGAPKDYYYYIDGVATAYSGGGMTSTGTYVYQGCVAVDPRKIPYGTEMWIVSLDGLYVYGYCRAEDTGGFIYMNRGVDVDLYMHSEDECNEWGVRGVRIYVLPTSY